MNFLIKKKMRRPERIPIILELLKDNINKKLILEYFFKPQEEEQMKLHESYNDIDFHVQRWAENFDVFSTDWQLTPDLRLTQALVNSGILPNYPGFWYFKEDQSLMIDCNLLEPRDIYFWGQNYDKDLNRLSETKWVLIKDMSTKHIESILKDVLDNQIKIHNKYIEFFNNEINYRKNI